METIYVRNEHSYFRLTSNMANHSIFVHQIYMELAICTLLFHPDWNRSCPLCQGLMKSWTEDTYYHSPIVMSIWIDKDWGGEILEEIRVSQFRMVITMLSHAVNGPVRNCKELLSQWDGFSFHQGICHLKSADSTQFYTDELCYAKTYPKTMLKRRIHSQTKWFTPLYIFISLSFWSS